MYVCMYIYICVIIVLIAIWDGPTGVPNSRMIDVMENPPENMEDHSLINSRALIILVHYFE